MIFPDIVESLAMDPCMQATDRLTDRCRGWVRAFGLVLLLSLSTGCTAMTNPVADGIPVRLLPPELLGPSKANLQTIPLTLLRQPSPDAYRLSHGDVLGVHIDGFTAIAPARGNSQAHSNTIFAEFVSTSGRFSNSSYTCIRYDALNRFPIRISEC